MDKKEIYRFLDEKNISYEVTEHKAVYNMAELNEINMPYPEADAKNIFIRDDRHEAYYMITVKGNKRVDLKAFRRANGTRALSFASESELKDILDLIPGSVTPLGLLNDKEKKVRLYLDKELSDGAGIIGVHPNDNTATVWLKVNDLVEIIREHGSEVHITDIAGRI